MNQTYRVRWGAATVFCGLLMACGQNSTSSGGAPVIVSGNSDKDIHTLQVGLDVKSDSAAVGGSNFQTPAGLRASYLFQSGQVRARMDLPAAMFPDGQARFLLMGGGGASATPRLYLTRTQALDAQFDGDAAASMLSQYGATPGGGLMDLKAPFKKLSADRFVVLARQAAFDIAGNSAGKVTVRQTFGNSKLPTTATLHFDEAVGAVTSVDTTTVSPVGTQTATSDIKYAAVPGSNDTSVPYQIVTKVTTHLQGDAALPPMRQPDAQALPPGQKVPLKPGEYVAQSFTAPAGGNGADLNNRTATQTMTYQDIKVNTLEPDFFLPGGN